MNPDSMYEATLARQQALIDEAADRRWFSGRPSKTMAAPSPRLRIRLASWLRRVADRLEPAATLAPLVRR